MNDRFNARYLYDYAIDRLQHLPNLTDTKVALTDEVDARRFQRAKEEALFIFPFTDLPTIVEGVNNGTHPGSVLKETIDTAQSLFPNANLFIPIAQSNKRQHWVLLRINKENQYDVIDPRSSPWIWSYDDTYLRQSLGNTDYQMSYASLQAFMNDKDCGHYVIEISCALIQHALDGHVSLLPQYEAPSLATMKQLFSAFHSVKYLERAKENEAAMAAVPDCDFDESDDAEDPIPSPHKNPAVMGAISDSDDQEPDESASLVPSPKENQRVIRAISDSDDEGPSEPRALIQSTEVKSETGLTAFLKYLAEQEKSCTFFKKPDGLKKMAKAHSFEEIQQIAEDRLNQRTCCFFKPFTRKKATEKLYRDLQLATSFESFLSGKKTQ